VHCAVALGVGFRVKSMNQITFAKQTKFEKKREKKKNEVIV
jgi:hypothetical protein